MPSGIQNSYYATDVNGKSLKNVKMEDIDTRLSWKQGKRIERFFVNRIKKGKIVKQSSQHSNKKYSWYHQKNLKKRDNKCYLCAGRNKADIKQSN